MTATEVREKQKRWRLLEFENCLGASREGHLKSLNGGAIIWDGTEEEEPVCWIRLFQYSLQIPQRSRPLAQGRLPQCSSLPGSSSWNPTEVHSSERQPFLVQNSLWCCLGYLLAIQVKEGSHVWDTWAGDKGGPGREWHYLGNNARM